MMTLNVFCDLLTLNFSHSQIVSKCSNLITTCAAILNIV